MSEHAPVIGTKSNQDCATDRIAGMNTAQTRSNLRPNGLIFRAICRHSKKLVRIQRKFF
jgi:hypothetical protein